MNPEFDTTAWPLLHVRARGRDSDESIARLLAGLEHHIARGRCAVVFDTTEIIYPTLGEAQRWMRLEGEWARTHRALIGRNVRAAGFVITNPAIRFILSGVLLIAPLPCEHVVTATAAEARAFCSDKLFHGAPSAPPGRSGRPSGRPSMKPRA